jgi:hypothetical protein
MAQISVVIQADPWSLATALAALPGNVSIAEKSSSAGKFIVVYDDSSDDQLYSVISGDPAKLASEINALIALGRIIWAVVPTFSAAHYVVVYS